MCYKIKCLHMDSLRNEEVSSRTRMEMELTSSMDQRLLHWLIS